MKILFYILLNLGMTDIYFKSPYTSSWGHAVTQVVEALRYEPEGRAFVSRLCQLNFH